MSEQHAPPPATPNGRGGLAGLDLEERGLRPPAKYGFFRRLWWWFDFLVLVKLARLRFIAILLLIGAVIAKWDYLVARYDKWVRPTAAQATASADTEFWCPMHPTVVREKPDKCPICAMPLSKRKKGEKDEEALPPGVVSRVQLTPYRVALAGVATAEVGYGRPHRDIGAVGFVEYDERRLARITARATSKSRIDKLHANVTGQTVTKGDPLALLYSPDLVTTVQNLLDARSSGNRNLERLARRRLDLWDIDAAQIDGIVKTGQPISQLTIRSPISGHVIKKYQVEGEYVEEGSRLYDVADLSTVWVEAQVYEDELPFLREGLAVRATTRAFPSRSFEGKLAFLHPHLDAATRTLKVRFDMKNQGHELRPGMYATVQFQVPAAELEAVAAGRARDWRDRATADLAAHAALSPMLPHAGAGLPSLLTGAVDEALARRGITLTVPETAVIDTGSRTLVYRESEPDVFDAVLVQLGPRCGDVFPVLSGLGAGDRVATAGSFLLDAETRLTAGAGSTYFGASGGPQGDRSSFSAAMRPSTTRDDESKVQGALAKLGAGDRRLALEQGYCPVLSNMLLGSMGVPVKVMVKGEPVFLCCRGCRQKALDDPGKTLAKVQELKVRPKGGTPAVAAGHPAVGTAAPKDAKLLANLAKLTPEDRKLASEQRYCVVMTDQLLGSMGKPVKLVVKGKPVFLCCAGCEDDARENPERTLELAEKLKANSKAAAPAKGGRP